MVRRLFQRQRIAHYWKGGENRFWNSIGGRSKGPDDRQSVGHWSRVEAALHTHTQRMATADMIPAEENRSQEVA